MHRFRRHRDGVELRLSAEEIEALALVPDLLDSVGEIDDDPAAARLTVAAYPEDEEAQDEFQRLMQPEIDAGRSADRSAMLVSLEAAADKPVILSTGEAEAWLIVLNESRLALAARMGIDKEGWGDDEADELEPSTAFLHYLTYLHAELTDVLMEML